MVGCVFFEPGDASGVIEAERAVHTEYESDRAGATTRFLRSWRTGKPRQAQGVDRIRWIAIADLLVQEKQGPVAEYRTFLLESLEHEDPEVASRAALALTHVTHPAVVNALLDSVESSADPTVRAAAVRTLKTKVTLRVFSDDDGDRATLLRRLDLTCGVKAPRAGMDAVCDSAKEDLRRYRHARALEACTNREGAQVAACIEHLARPFPACLPGLEPIEYSLKGLPFRRDNTFSGKILIGVVIDRAGEVTSPLVVSTQWRPAQHSAGAPKGYDEAIVASVLTWKYPPPPTTCLHEVPVQVDWGDGEGAQVIE